MIAWHELFARQLDAQPNNVALREGSVSLTYAQVDELADRLVARLQRMNLPPESCVGLAMNSCADLVPCMLACARCGVAFLPMDPGLPLGRLEYMATTASVRVVLVNNENVESLLRLRLQGQSFLLVPLPPSEPILEPLLPTDGSRLAYTMFTSGSTGQPKGVQIEHGALGNFLLGMLDALNVRPPEVAGRLQFLALTTPSFDISLVEMLLPLTCGGEVVFAGAQAARDPRELAQVIARYQLTHMQATPTAWQMLLASDWQPPPELTLISGGEALPEATAAGLLATGSVVFNVYGPTETTIYSTVGEIVDATRVHVGAPIVNTSIHVFDDSLQPVPRGEVGELCIGGAGLARGYLELPELTARQFPEISDESSSDVCRNEATARSTRIYRTGDRARVCDDGCIEVLGRLDSQIKLRGHRIEPGEIESRLLLLPEIAGAAVVMQAETDRQGLERLVGYYVLACDSPASVPDEGMLKRKLLEWLPDYMVPARLIPLDELPLTPNGKLDRKCLPLLTEAQGIDYEPPRNDLEALMCLLFAEVLELERVGLRENFFACGGHSLLAVMLVAELEGAIGFRLPVRLVFEYPTVGELCAAIAEVP